MVFRLDQCAVQRGDGGVVVFLVDHALHLHLTDRLVDRLDADAGLGQSGHGLGQNALDLEVGADGRNDGQVVHGDLGGRVLLLDQPRGAVDQLARTGGVVGDAVGVGILVHHIELELLEQLADLHVVADVAEHVLVEHLDAEDVLAPGDDLDAGLLGLVVLADQRAAMLGLEGILDAQFDAGATQGLGGARVDRLHAEVRQLVGDVVVGAADGDHLVGTHQIRVGRGEVKFLVDDGLACAGGGGDLGEGDLAVAAIEGIHQTFGAMGVTGGDHQFAAEVEAGEVAGNHLLERQRCFLLPAGEVGQARVDAALLERQHRVEGAVGFAEGSEHLAHLHQVFGELEVAVGAKLLQAVHALAGIVDARVDELVGGVQFVLGTEQLGVLGEHALAHTLQRFAPGTFALRIGEALVDAGLAGLLVLQQQVGHAAVGRDDEDALVQRCAFPAADEDIVENFLEAAHRRAADLFHGMHLFIASESGRPLTGPARSWRTCRSTSWSEFPWAGSDRPSRGKGPVIRRAPSPQRYCCGRMSSGLKFSRSATKAGRGFCSQNGACTALSTWL